MIFHLCFPKKDDGSRFGAGETSVYNITYSGVDIADVSSFAYLSDLMGGQGVYFSSAHIQGIF